MYLYHYFEKERAPFLTLSDLDDEEAKRIQGNLKENDNVYARRDYDGKYIYFRRIVESKVRSAFIDKGGKPVRPAPLYFILGESHNRNHTIYKEWYKYPDLIEIPIGEFDMDTVSFTYGDSFVENHPEHHNQCKYHERVYTYNEILEVLSYRGWPQDSVKNDSPFWVPRYIEAQIWSNETISKYRVKTI